MCFSKEQHVTVHKYEPPPRAVLADLMLTACDVVIFHLLMGNTAPDATAAGGEKGFAAFACISLWFLRTSTNTPAPVNLANLHVKRQERISGRTSAGPISLDRHHCYVGGRGGREPAYR